MVGYDPLFDAETGTEVGTFAYECLGATGTVTAKVLDLNGDFVITTTE
jgi:hypothetical protein